MKLRNKKTGEIFYPDDWEAFEPTEPLIKDEKIRKAVRAWAELSGVDKCHFEHNDGSFASKWYGISLPTSAYGEDIESGFYTIAELCGEEEAPEPLEPTFVDIDERIKEREEE